MTLFSIAPSAEAAEIIKEEARRCFQEARQECLRYQIRQDSETKIRAIEAFNRVYQLYLECGFSPKEIGTTYLEATTLYQAIGFFRISNQFASFFHLHQK